MRLAVYIAGATKEPERVRWAMREAIAAGYVLTLDWLAEIEAAGMSDDALGEWERRRYARADLDAIDRADVVWLLASVQGRGSWVELGYALRGQKTVVVSGPDSKRSIFSALAVEARTDDDAVEYLRALAERTAAEVGR